MTELRTDEELVEAVKEEFPPKQKPKIKFGQLRERVKKGELDPKDVLTWYKEQPDQFSRSLVTFLKNQAMARRKKPKEEQKDKKEKKRGRKPSKRNRGRRGEA